MKLLAKTLGAAGLAAAAVSATPASAQVAGIATASPEAVIVRSAARQAAYQTISQTYAAQIQQVQGIRQQIQNLQRSLDTNNDGQLTDAEVQANPTVVQQIQQQEQQAAQITQPIALAQAYAIEQVIAQYDAARQQVVSQRGIQILLTPDAIQWAPETVNVTDALVAALDQRVPTVQSAPPAGWQPQRQSVALQQAVQQILLGVAQQQAIQAAQQQQAQQPSGR